MTRTRSAFVSLALLLTAAACGGKPEKAAPATTTGAATEAKKAAADDADAELSPKARLALQKLTGTSGADKAVEDAKAAVRRQMTKDDGWIVLGRAWIRKARESNDPGFYLNADACAAVVLEQNPDHALALGLRGLVLLNGHEFAEAADLAAKIVSKHPDDPMAWGTSSDALLEMGRYDEAAVAAQRMVDLKPNLPSYSRASHLQWLRGDVANAKQTVRAALDAGRDAKRDPEPGAWVLVQAAMIFWNEGDFDGAEAGFDRALERISDYAPANVGKGRVAMARREHRRAAELFGRAFAVSPLVETAWLLGDARALAGDAKGAEEAYARVERDGRRTDPRTLSLFLSTKGTDAAGALQLARQEYASRKDILTEDALAWALYRSGEIDEARASIVRARRLGTPDARLVFHEGAIRRAAGEKKKGEALVAQALKMNPAFDATGVKEAEALLGERLAAR
ncbi:MAG: tetratricopeptide repeat protein [Labilithrix sp.]|nr:tetratricopeptide repeat protein [Labilithrix sp.]